MPSGPQTPVRPGASGFEIEEPQDDPRLLRGVQTGTQRKVTLVALADAGTPEADALKRELDLLAQVRDRHVVEVLGTHVQGGKLWCAMEAVDGEDLATQLREGHRFTTEEILHIGECLARGLGAASYHGFLHHDLRPAHVMILDDGQVKVANFGPLARRRALANEATPSPATVAYLSPEEGSGQPLDIRANIYSVGAILYELATQRPPFEGYDSSTSLLYQLLHVDPLGPRQLGSSIPKELERTILRCLSKAPVDRYSQPSELLEALRQSRDSISSTKVSAIRNQEDDTGDFDIFEDQPLGEGGMGTLLRGRQRSLDRAVAIKVIREAFHTHPEFLQRFRREGELLAQVENANVVQIIGTGIWHGRVFYAMELVKGEDLAARQMRGHRSTPEEILHIAEGVASALRAAWRYKIIHRDIKPSNIMITQEGTIKVADFGLAKSLRLPGAESRVMAGTPEYLSPEQGLGQKADIRADIYSLGVVLYELAAGRHPFKETQSSVAMIYQHVHTEPPPLEQLDPKCPPALRGLIHRCLQKDPDARFENPDELLKAIRAARKNMDLPPTSKRMIPAAAPAPSPRKLLVPLLALLLLPCGFVAWQILKSRPMEPTESDRAYELAMGLGNPALAMKIAEASKGRDSREYREAERRERNLRLRPLEERACERVAARDWTGAADAYGTLQSQVDPERRKEISAALRLCDSLKAAAEKEAKADWAGALEIYLRLQSQGAPVRDVLEESIRRVRSRMDPSAPR
ncbi:MAG: serine/threonine protein kinase [Planctomycetaceae bacterium]|nr:serine/threonine protein kinase [Planctomycetaceae bacterium]